MFRIASRNEGGATSTMAPPAFISGAPPLSPRKRDSDKMKLYPCWLASSSGR